MLRFGLEWVLIESIENGREITLTCVWKENHDLLALVLWTCCNLSCSKCCCTRRDTYEETFCLCKLTTCADSIIIIDIDYLVDNVCVVCLWNKACTNTLNLVRTALTAVEDRRGERLNRINLHVRVLLLEILTDTRNSTASTYTSNEDIYL